MNVAPVIIPAVIKAMAAATPISKFVGVAGLPKAAQDWIVSKFGTAEKADAALVNQTNAQVLAAWLLSLSAAEVAPQTDALATGEPLWLACLQRIVTAIVDGEASVAVGGVSAVYAATARVDGLASLAKAAGLIADGNRASATALAAAEGQVAARFAQVRADADALFDGWRGKVASDYAKKATDLVYTRAGTPLDPQFLQPIRLPDPLGQGAAGVEFPQPFPKGYATAKYPTPFAPIVTYLSNGSQLANSQLILASIPAAVAKEWNTTVLPAVQMAMDVAWLAAAVATQRIEAADREKIYAKLQSDYAAQMAQAQDLLANIIANSNKQLAALPPFAAAVVKAAGTKLGLVKSAEMRVATAQEIQKLAVKQAVYTNYLAFLQQALANVKVTGTSLFVDVAAQLLDIGKANEAAALGASAAGKVQSEQAGAAKQDIATATAPPTSAIGAAADNTATGQQATQIAAAVGNEANNKDANGGAITTTSDDSAKEIVDPSPSRVEEEPKSSIGPILAIGAGLLLAKALLSR